MELVKKKEFVAITLNPNIELFIVYIAFFTSFYLGLEIHPSYKAWIAFLKADETLICISFKYSDFANILTKNLVVKLSKHTKINNNTIDLVDG